MPPFSSTVAVECAEEEQNTHPLRVIADAIDDIYSARPSRIPPRDEYDPDLDERNGLPPPPVDKRGEYHHIFKMPTLAQVVARLRIDEVIVGNEISIVDETIVINEACDIERAAFLIRVWSYCRMMKSEIDGATITMFMNAGGVLRKIGSTSNCTFFLPGRQCKSSGYGTVTLVDGVERHIAKYKGLDGKYNEAITDLEKFKCKHCVEANIDSATLLLIDFWTLAQIQ